MNRRRPLLAGNWKMHLNIPQAVELAHAVTAACADCTDRDVMLAPPFTALASVALALQGSSVLLGSQNVAWEAQGAFTGEISPPMLTDIGVHMAIIGHSERRQIFFEDDAMINRRLRATLEFGLIPVLCIGETLQDRESGATFTVLEKQLRGALQDVVPEQAEQIVLAYEPVWAIGTGKTASAEQAQEAHHFLRSLLAGMYNKKVAESIRVLYGGSVKPDNIDILMTQADIDGALVGGAALSIDSFKRIIRFQ
ncbi:MAG: triose-phosphate isomerase [Desulfobulbaceae bacterium]|nr:triose-phosphate isomerase [Desulfobulbaceae bacterium]